MEAANGFEYRVLKIRGLGFNAPKAVARARQRAAGEGWEVVSESVLGGFVTTPVLTLRRPLATPEEDDDDRVAAGLSCTKNDSL
jgi:hypothetical protein